MVTKVIAVSSNKEGTRTYYTLADTVRYRQYNASLDVGMFGSLRVGEEIEVEGDFLGEKVYFRGVVVRDSV